MDEENKNTNSEAPMSESGLLAGKFKSVDALLHAYGELEAEFTRRSQRIKALEEKLQGHENAAKEVTPAPEKPVQKQDISHDAALPSQAAHGQEELLRAVLADEEVKARVACDYLRSLRGAPLMGFTGSSIVAPVKKPTTIAEAGNLALGYLKAKK